MSNTFKFDINGQTQLTYALDATFDKMAQELEPIEKDVLNVGAYYLKGKVKESFMSRMPSATKPVHSQLYKGKRSPDGYQISSNEPLIEAVRQTSPNLANRTTKIHILGSGKPNSSTFMARFFEHGTEPRYATRYKGKRMKKKRSTGRIRPYDFFESTVSSNMDGARDVMGEVYENKVNNILKDGQ